MRMGINECIGGVAGGTMGRIKLLTLTVGAAAMPLLAQNAARPGSSFAIVGQPPAETAEQLARPNATLVELKARPVSAVTLETAIAPELAVLFGAKADAPFDTARRLYGWPERPGLYCDLLRTRGLGLSTACLYDSDGDGRFDQGRRFDFNSAVGDLLGITPSGKIIGVRSTAKPAPVPLPQPIGFKAASVPAEVSGRLALKWRKVNVGGTTAGQLWITTPDNYTGTEGLSEQVVQFRLDRAPLDVELYGIKVRILGFDEKGAMRYRLLGISDGATVPLLFRGYTFRIIMI